MCMTEHVPARIRAHTNAAAECLLACDMADSDVITLVQSICNADLQFADRALSHVTGKPMSGNALAQSPN